MKKCGLVFVLVLMLSLVSFGAAKEADAAPGQQGGGNVHHVAYGETLYSIAMEYGVSVEAILRYNGLRNPNMIYVGQPLTIPGGYGGHHYADVSCSNYHPVRGGETLSSIAYRYGLTIGELVAYNNFYNQDMVYVGQKVCLPTKSGYAPKPHAPAGYSHHGPPANAFYHTVTRGETLHRIAKHYSINYITIIDANDLANAGLIVPGQQLYIPEYQPAPVVHHPPVHKEYKKDYDDYAVGPPEIIIPAGPPPAPAYDGGDYHDVPPAPDYQAFPETPLLPEAPHPIEVVVNGGSIWTGEVYPNHPDPDGDTILIVSTREETDSTVWLRSGDYEVKGELGLVPEFGVDQFRFAFRYIPAGDYDVWFEDPDGTLSERVPVEVEPGKRVEVNFRKGVGFSGPTYASPDGWILANWDNPSEPGKNLGGWSNILIRTPASGLWVKIESEGGGYQAKCFTGTKGPGACDFAGLSAGMYYIWIDGTDLTLKTYMDGNAYAEFDFARQPVQSSENVIGPVDYSD